MANRFDTYLPSDFSFSIHTPQEYTPDLSMLDSLLGGLQKEYDTGMSTLNRIMPNYWREHPTDVEAAKNYRSKFDSAIAQTTEAFANGNINEGRRLMSNAMREIEKDQLPGGDFYELERRAKEAAEQDKALKKTYIDEYKSPELYQYARSKMVDSAQPFKDPATGEYGIVGSPAMSKHIPQEEVVNQLDKIIDNIQADQVVYGGYRGKKLDGVSFKQLLERGEIEKIDYSKVANVLASAVSPEMTASYNQLGAALGIQDNQGRAIATEEEFKNTGSVFAPTMLGATLESLAQSKVYRKQTDKSSIVTDEYARERALKKASDEDDRLRAFRTTVYTKGSGMPELNIGVNKKGEVLEKNLVPGSFPAPGGFIPDPNRPVNMAKPLGKKFKKYLESGEAAKDNPALAGIYDEFKVQIDQMSDSKAYEFIEKKYNEKKDRLSVTEDVMYPFNEKEREYYNNLYIGTSKGKDEGALGLSSQMAVTVYEPGKEPEVYSGVQAFLDEKGISRGEWTRNTNTYGDVRADNPAVIAGIRGAYVDNEGQVYEFSLSHKDEQTMREELPLSILGSTMMDGGLAESHSTNMVLPSVDNIGNPVLENRLLYSKGQDIYESDELIENIGEYERARALGKELPFRETEYRDMKDRYNLISNNPTMNTYAKRKALIYDAQTDRPLVDAEGKQMTYDDLLKLNRIMQQR